MVRTQSLVHRQRLRTSQDFSTVLLIDITKAWFRLRHRLISGRSSIEDRGDTHPHIIIEGGIEKKMDRNAAPKGWISLGFWETAHLPRVRKYAKIGIFYAKIVQMTPPRLWRES